MPRRKPLPRTASILISPEGETTAAFLWDDLFRPDLDLPATIEGRHLASPLAEYASCECCPKRCGFDRRTKAHPTCGDSALRVASHGFVLGDEAPISGSRGSGAIMLSGCPLRCPSCHSLEMVNEGTSVSLEEFITLSHELVDRGAHNLQILSPTCHLPSLRVVLRELREEKFPVPIVWKSSGFESVEELRKLEGLVDVYLPDLKFGSCSVWAAKAGAKNYFEVAKVAITEMIRQVGPLVLGADGLAFKGVLVRHVRAPLPQNETREIEEFLRGLSVDTSFLDEFLLLDQFSLDQSRKRDL